MSLKILKATFTEQVETDAGMGAATTTACYLAGPDLLRIVDEVALDTSASGGTATEIEVTATRQGWATAAGKLNPVPRQTIRIAGVEVVKAPDSYYMNANFDTPGAQDRGGPSYNEFRRIIAQVGDSPTAAQAVRGALRGTVAGLNPDPRRAVAALSAALFLAEPRRNKRAFPINLMLLDFIERSVPYGSHGKSYTWESVLWRDVEKEYQYATGGVEAQAHQRGGKLPMSNTGAVEQSQVGLPVAPDGGANFHLPNAEIDKECTIVVRWLVHYLGKRHAAQERVDRSSGAWGTAKKKDIYYSSVSFEGLQQGGIAGNYVNLLRPASSQDARLVKMVRDAVGERNKGLQLLLS